MSTGGGQTTQNVTQNSAPWQPAQPYLTDLFGQAQNTYLNAQGQAGTYPNDVAPFSPTTQQALSLTAQRALNGSPLVNTADQSLTNILNGSQSAPGNDALTKLLGGYNNPGDGIAQQLAAGQTAGQGALSSIATSGVNPYLKSMYDAASQPVIDSVNSQFGLADRTGSAANQQELTRNLGELAGNIYGSNYNQAIQNQEGAANSLIGAQQNGASLLSNNAANQASTIGQAAQNLNNNFNTQNQQAVSAASFAVPQMVSQDWTSLQNLLSTGQAQDQQNQNLLNNNLAAWSYQQQQPWNILDNYSGVLTGLGSLGGSKTGTQTTQQPGQSLLPSLIGGAIQMAPFLLA